jgi:hypothetical protein
MEKIVRGFLARATATALLSGFVSTAAFAQTAAASPTKVKDRSQEMICEKVEVIGSRLASKRVCMTRAEWADARLQDRQAVDRAQVQRPMNGN